MLETAIVLDNFLPDLKAEILFSFLQELPPQEWYWNIKPASRGYMDYAEFRNTEANQGEIKAAIEQANKANDGQNFCYNYLRLRHAAGCSCPVCECEAFLQLPKTLKSISRVIREPLQNGLNVACTWYASGCFLSTHTDERNGRIAFIYQLTKNWSNDFGGVLHLLSRDGTTILKSFPSEFNRLIIFGVSGPDLTPHFVSRTNCPLDVRRLAISGWYS